MVGLEYNVRTKKHALIISHSEESEMIFQSQTFTITFPQTLITAIVHHAACRQIPYEKSKAFQFQCTSTLITTAYSNFN